MLDFSKLLVVSLEQAVAAPYCSCKLADAGARVIKIERAEGDFARNYDSVVHGESAYFIWLNRGKESLCLNIKDKDDAKVFQDILDEADVFIQNLAPGAIKRAGFGAEELRKKNPKLITVDISGYGEHGEYSKMKAYDLLVQCETGLASITGTPDAPGRVGLSVCDISCGQQAYTAVLEALIRREQTGVGTGIEISLFDSIADWMTVPLMHYDYGDKTQPRVGINHATIAPYGAYQTAEGKQIVIAIQNEREWKNLCEKVLGDPDIATDTRFDSNNARVENRDDLNLTINAVFNKMPHKECETKLFEAAIAYGNLNDMEGLSNHPQLRRQTVETPTGPAQLISNAAQYSDHVVKFGKTPTIGEHSDAIRKEFSK